METVKKYRENETVEGVQKMDQLDDIQRQGLKSLKEKVKNGAIHIGPSDKGKGLKTMTLDFYDTISKVNVEADAKTSWKE